VPDTAVADLTLTEILAERASAKDASEAWLYDRDVVQRRRADIEALREITRFYALGDLLDSAAAGEVLPVLVGADPRSVSRQPTRPRPAGIRTRSAGAVLRWMFLIIPEKAAVYRASSPDTGSGRCCCWGCCSGVASSGSSALVTANHVSSARQPPTPATPFRRE
jgi:hypothetical protein